MWKIYASRAVTHTYSDSSNTTFNVFSVNASETTTDTVDVLYHGSFTGSGDNCPPSFDQIQTTACTSTGSYSNTNYNNNGGVRGSLANRTTISRSHSNGDPPCIFRDTEVFTIFPSGNQTTTLHVGEQLTTIYSTVGPPTADTTTTVYTDGKTYDEWVTLVQEAIESKIDFSNEDCLDADPTCESSVIISPDVDPEQINYNILIQVKKAQYRMGIPEGFTGPTYELFWDEIFFSTEWLAWNDSQTAYENSILIHESWIQCEIDFPGECGDEPEILPDPGAAPDTPEVLASPDWIYSGTEFSEWFTMVPAPAPGVVKIMNLLSLSWKSQTLGQVGTSWGEIFEVD